MTSSDFQQWGGFGTWARANGRSAAEAEACEVECTACQARVNDRCLAPTGLLASGPHPARVRKARAARAAASAAKVQGGLAA